MNLLNIVLLNIIFYFALIYSHAYFNSKEKEISCMNAERQNYVMYYLILLIYNVMHITKYGFNGRINYEQPVNKIIKMP